MPAKIATVYVRSKTPGPQPNGLHAADDGLWYIDQRDDRVYKLDWDTGEELLQLQTRTVHSSGITIGDGHLWIASTYDCTIHKCDIETGETIQEYDTPGKGVVAFRNPAVDARVTGAHGLEWRDGKIWIAVPPSQMIYQVDPASWEVLHEIKAPGLRVHGIAFTDDGFLWSADTAAGTVSLLNTEDGRVVDVVRVPGPCEVHGMTIKNDVLWYCDAQSRDVGQLVW
jgi:streptogramin lyase